jgi:hypothetical protein
MWALSVISATVTGCEIPGRRAVCDRQSRIRIALLPLAANSGQYRETRGLDVEQPAVDQRQHIRSRAGRIR